MTATPERVGFFTDTTCASAARRARWRARSGTTCPKTALDFTGNSYDNTGELGANTWRHVAFIERSASAAPERRPARASAGSCRSDVCKHCTHAACLDVCPTGALFRTEFGTVVVQQDVCNGCGYCVPACPFGVIDQREDDGPRLEVHALLRPAEARARARVRAGVSDRLDPVRPARRAARARPQIAWRRCTTAASIDARLYGADDDDGVGGFGAFFLLLDEPEVYGLPPDPVVTDTRPARLWRWAAAAAAALVGAVAVVAARGTALMRAARRPRSAMVPDAESASPTTTARYSRRRCGSAYVPAYFFAGGLAAGSSVLAAGRRRDWAGPISPAGPGSRQLRARRSAASPCC